LIEDGVIIGGHNEIDYLFLIFTVAAQTSFFSSFLQCSELFLFEKEANY